MREIKFRGKSKDTGKWIYGDLIHWKWSVEIKSKDEEIELSRTVIPETVGEYTGLKDKNGKEIYEGDIVEFDAHGKKQGVVKYSDTHCHFYIQYSNSIIHYSLWSKVLIIGNIYENPNL